MDGIPKIVLSKTLDDRDASWPTTRVARGNLASQIVATRPNQDPGALPNASRA